MYVLMDALLQTDVPHISICQTEEYVELLWKLFELSEQGSEAKPLLMLAWVINVSTSPDLYIEFSTVLVQTLRLVENFHI